MRSYWAVSGLNGSFTMCWTCLDLSTMLSLKNYFTFCGSWIQYLSKCTLRLVFLKFKLIWRLNWMTDLKEKHLKPHRFSQEKFTWNIHELKKINIKYLYGMLLHFCIISVCIGLEVYQYKRISMQGFWISIFLNIKSHLFNYWNLGIE